MLGECSLSITMTAKISPEKMAIYRAAARRRQQQRQELLARRRQRAWEVARQAAEILKTEFGVEKVVVLGSMLSIDRIHQRSDLDLAVWGLIPQRYYRAVGRLLSLEPSMPVDLVEVEIAPTDLLTSIGKEGIEV